MRLGLIAITLCSVLRAQTLEEAKRAFDAGNYAAAAKKFEQAYQATHNCETLFYLGMAQYRGGQADAALVSFQGAVSCDPRLIRAHLALAEAYAAKGNTRGALAAFTSVLQLDPDNREALAGAASIYLQQNDNNKAVEVLARLAQLEPQDPQVHADLGAAYFATGDQDAAEHQFQRAIALKPDHAAALLGIANLRIRGGEEGEAIALIQRVIKLNPNAFEPRFLLGSSYNRMGRYAEAVDELQAALRLGGRQPEIYYHLARAHGKLGRTEERRQALAEFAALTRKADEDTEAHRRALKLTADAKSLVDAGDLRTAVFRLEEARVLRPSDDHILFRLAGLHYDLRSYDQARPYAEEAIALAPTEWLYHYLLGLIEKASEHWQAAQKSLEVAAQLNPSAAEVRDALGEVKRKLEATRGATR
jgi:tetratricopeptide (TPR) repeat protein